MDAYTLQRARNSEGVAREWKAYAEELERKLAVYAANYAGMEALKNVAVTELARVDPKNYLTVQQNRQRILEAARDAALNEKRAA
jgi:ribosomal protein S18